MKSLGSSNDINVAGATITGWSRSSGRTRSPASAGLDPEEFVPKGMLAATRASEAAAHVPEEVA